ncbi:MAG: hypothetical protein ACK52I_30275 [Pseudomonadota bacterium]
MALSIRLTGRPRRTSTHRVLVERTMVQAAGAAVANIDGHASPALTPSFHFASGAPEAPTMMPRERGREVAR